MTYSSAPSHLFGQAPQRARSISRASSAAPLAARVTPAGNAVSAASALAMALVHLREPGLVTADIAAFSMKNARRRASSGSMGVGLGAISDRKRRLGAGAATGAKSRSMLSLNRSAIRYPQGCKSITGNLCGQAPFGDPTISATRARTQALAWLASSEVSGEASDSCNVRSRLMAKSLRSLGASVVSQADKTIDRARNSGVGTADTVESFIGSVYRTSGACVGKMTPCHLRQLAIVRGLFHDRHNFTSTRLMSA